MAENNQLYIIDASVLLKPFIEETQDLEKAIAVQKDFLKYKIKLGMPSFCLYELLNTLCRKFPDKAMPSLSQILMLNIKEYRLNLENLYIALTIMQKFSKVSFYDAVYHAIAIENGGIFVTADENYYKTTRSLKHIRLLKNYSPLSRG